MGDCRAVFAQAVRSGHRRRWQWREVLNSIFYVLRTGSGALRDSGGFECLNHHLVQMDLVRAGREPIPSAPVIDGQSVKTAEAAGPRGYGASKTTKGRERHAMMNMDGRRSSCWFIQLTRSTATVPRLCSKCPALGTRS